MNYFNYFTEIEDAFVRRRNKHVYLSPIDWALIESWKEKGVPLHVALSGIERAFDSHDAKPRPRSVKSLMYCQEEVEAQFISWLDSQIGAGPSSVPTDELRPDKDSGEADEEKDAGLPFPRASILEHLRSARDALVAICNERQRTGEDDFCETLVRAVARLDELEKDFARAARPDAEKLEGSLTSLEKILDQALRAKQTLEELTAARLATEAQLQSYRARMEQKTFEQTFDNLLLKRLREQSGLPRLSLFYL